MNEIFDQLIETSQDIAACDIDKWELKHGRIFYLRDVPDLVLHEIFQYVNCHYIDHAGGYDFDDIKENNKWNQNFRTLCFEFSKIIEPLDCITTLSVVGSNLKRIDLDEQDLIKIESLRYLRKIDLKYVNMKRLPEFNDNLKFLTIVESNLTALSVDSNIKLIKLVCRQCLNLEIIPKDLNATSLKYLDVYYSRKIETIPNHFVNLRYLNVSGTQVDILPREFVELVDVFYQNSKVTKLPVELINLID